MLQNVTYIEVWLCFFYSPESKDTLKPRSRSAFSFRLDSGFTWLAERSECGATYTPLGPWGSSWKSNLKLKAERERGFTIKIENFK
jgi:hypothetical protein